MAFGIFSVAVPFCNGLRLGVCAGCTGGPPGGKGHRPTLEGSGPGLAQSPGWGVFWSAQGRLLVERPALAAGCFWPQPLAFFTGNPSIFPAVQTAVAVCPPGYGVA